MHGAARAAGSASASLSATGSGRIGSVREPEAATGPGTAVVRGLLQPEYY